VRYGEKTQAQALTSQSSFYSANDSRLHFGLGNAATADLDIFWPSGHSQTFKDESADQLLTVVEGKGVVSRERLGPRPTTSVRR
jgi:enediyne biosynthesis protein E4